MGPGGKVTVSERNLAEKAVLGNRARMLESAVSPGGK